MWSRLLRSVRSWWRKSAAAAALLLMASACAHLYPDRLAADIAAEAKLQPSVVSTTSFVLQRFARAARPGLKARLHVYIEGDGNAFNASTQEPNYDPTPLDPTALRLAAADSSGRAVIYLARPCQYILEGGAIPCTARVWTSERYGEAAIGALNQAIDRSKAESGATEVVLVGFSGGGTLAALLAARRSDVGGLVTVAAPLDIDRWSDVMKVPRFSSTSLNPVKDAERLKGIWQVHLRAANDEVVPAAVHASFQEAITGVGGPQVVVSKDTEAAGSFRMCARSVHECGWPELWPSILQEFGLSRRP